MGGRGWIVRKNAEGTINYEIWESRDPLHMPFLLHLLILLLWAGGCAGGTCPYYALLCWWRSTCDLFHSGKKYICALCHIGRSPKASFRRFLIYHVLEYVNVQIERPVESREPLNLSKVVAIYDTVRMIPAAWNLVSRKGVINGWFSCKILALYQKEELHAA